LGGDVVAGVSIPHFDLPFRFTPGVHASVVQQDAIADVSNCVFAIVNTERGSRYYHPTFGIDDPTFDTMPLDTNKIIDQVIESEPRAAVAIDQVTDVISSTITMGVDTTS
jgi:phage baseplate assembly protein W